MLTCLHSKQFSEIWLKYLVSLGVSEAQITSLDDISSHADGLKEVVLRLVEG